MDSKLGHDEAWRFVFHVLVVVLRACRPSWRRCVIGSTDPKPISEEAWNSLAVCFEGSRSKPFFLNVTWFYHS